MQRSRVRSGGKTSRPRASFLRGALYKATDDENVHVREVARKALNYIDGAPIPTRRSRREDR